MLISDPFFLEAITLISFPFLQEWRQLKVPGDQRDAIHQGPANLTTAFGFLFSSADDMEEILPAGGIGFPADLYRCVLGPTHAPLEKP